MPADAMARGFARWSRRVGRGLVRSRGGASATPVAAPEHPGGGSVDPGTFAGGGAPGPRSARRFGSPRPRPGRPCSPARRASAGRRARDGADARDGRVRDGSGGALANGAVVAPMGDTVAMCAATTARQPDSDASFFPLSVDYRERASAYGKIPATFTRREGPPKDREVPAMARRRPRAPGLGSEGLQERDQRAGGGAGVRPEPGPGGARGERRERGARRLRHTLRRARRRARRRERPATCRQPSTPTAKPRASCSPTRAQRTRR